MATGQVNEVLQHLRRAVLLQDGAGLTDGELLTAFINRRDEAAFAALVRRHGPMVWGVCRRLLFNYEDAEDAFQATFLVLARRAACIRPRSMVANWLYGVAHQTALKARAVIAKRKGRERQVKEMPEPSARPEPDRWGDLRPLLDQELSRLPGKYRAVLVLCDLEGKARKEAARQLKLPEGTVRSRLARARTMLARRLTERGVALSAGSLAVVLSHEAAAASVPASVVSSTIQALPAAVQGAAGGIISAKAAALAEGVVRTMWLAKRRAVVAVILAFGILTTGTMALTHLSAGQGDTTPTKEKRVKTPRKQEQQRAKENLIAWGMQVGGLQAGLEVRPAGRRAYRYGETVTLVVRVRNVGKEMVQFEYLKEFFIENPPRVTDADGKTVPEPSPEVTRLRQDPVQVSLTPGKEIELVSVQYELTPASERAKGSSGRLLPLFVGTGKVSVQYHRLFGNTSGGRIKVDPDLLKLATGTLELEVEPSDPPPAKAQPATPKTPKEAVKQPEAKADVFAWGKALDKPAAYTGLQVGIGVGPRGKRTYRAGEVATVTLKARNAGKAPITISYYEKVPLFGLVVEDDKGKRVKLLGGVRPEDSPKFAQIVGVGKAAWRQQSLKPGEEVEFGRQQLAFLSPKGNLNSWPRLLVTNPAIPAVPGKYKLSYVDVCLNMPKASYNLGTIPVQHDAVTASTGQVEIEIKGEARQDEPKNAKVWTIEEVLRQLPRQAITVEFKVGQAGKVWATGATLGAAFDKKWKATDEPLTLTPTGPAAKKFYVTVYNLTEARLKALGLSRPGDLVGRRVRVTGQVDVTSRPARPNTTGRIIAWEPAQIELLK